MSIQAKIDKLERLAASTTFPGEAANARAKAAKLRARLNQEQARETIYRFTDADLVGEFSQAQWAPSRAQQMSSDARLVNQGLELFGWLGLRDRTMVHEFQRKVEQYGSLTPKQRKWLQDIVERGWAKRR